VRLTIVSVLLLITVLLFYFLSRYHVSSSILSFSGILLFLFALLCFWFAFFCFYSFGAQVDSFPPPQMDMKGFLRNLDQVNNQIPKTWNPITQRMEFWFNRHQIQKYYSKKGGCTVS
jgi:energy-coupling factor transporter transmembrane protein EcfT